MTIPYICSSRETLYQEVKRLEAELSLATPAEAGTCEGVCSEEGKRYLQKIPAWPWRLRIKGAHVEVTYCPFCGRKLDA